MWDAFTKNFLDFLSRTYGDHFAISFLLTALAIFVVVHISILIVRAKQGHELEFSFLGYKHISRPSTEVKKLEEAVAKLKREWEMLNEDLKHKTDVLTYIDQVGTLSQKTISYATDTEHPEEASRSFDQTIDFILHAILHCVRSGRKDLSRICILVPDNAGKDLMILKGHGYSADSHRKMRLPIGSSFAGEAFRTQSLRSTGDLSKITGSFVRLPGQHAYNSLICAPILFVGEPLGVLNLDAEDLDSFGEFDIKIVTVFANQLALLLIAHQIRLERKQNAVAESASSLEKGV